MISLTNHDFQWGRSEVVIIYPDMITHDPFFSHHARNHHSSSTRSIGESPWKSAPWIAVNHRSGLRHLDGSSHLDGVYTKHSSYDVLSLLYSCGIYFILLCILCSIIVIWTQYINYCIDHPILKSVVASEANCSPISIYHH